MINKLEDNQPVLDFGVAQFKNLIILLHLGGISSEKMISILTATLIDLMGRNLEGKEERLRMANELGKLIKKAMDEDIWDEKHES